MSILRQRVKCGSSSASIFAFYPLQHPHIRFLLESTKQYGQDWIEQGLTSPPTQYRLSGRRDTGSALALVFIKKNKQMNVILFNAMLTLYRKTYYQSTRDWHQIILLVRGYFSRRCSRSILCEKQYSMLHLHRSVFSKRVVNCDTITIFRYILLPEIQPHRNDNDS